MSLGLERQALSERIDSLAKAHVDVVAASNKPSATAPAPIDDDVVSAADDDDEDDDVDATAATTSSTSTTTKGGSRLTRKKRYIDSV